MIIDRAVIKVKTITQLIIEVTAAIIMINIVVFKCCEVSSYDHEIYAFKCISITFQLPMVKVPSTAMAKLGVFPIAV